MESLELQIIKAKVADFRKEGEKIKNLVKSFCQDTSKPLEERWGLFVDSEMGEHYPYILHFKSRPALVAIDELENKYETITMTNMLYRVEHSSKVTELEVTEFKEEALSKFIYSFEFDW